MFVLIFHRFRLHFGTLIWTPNLATGFKEGPKPPPNRLQSGPLRRRGVQERSGPFPRPIFDRFGIDFRVHFWDDFQVKSTKFSSICRSISCVGDGFWIRFFDLFVKKRSTQAASGSKSPFALSAISPKMSRRRNSKKTCGRPVLYRRFGFRV